MVENLARNWWLLAVRGGLAILFALLTFFMPGITITVLVILFGVYALVDGFFAAGVALRAARRHRGWTWPTVQGAVGIAAGILALAFPIWTAVAIVRLLAVWAVVTGVLEIIHAIRVRQEITNEWAIGLSGLLSVIFGIAVFFVPEAGLLAWAWVVGAFAFAWGVALIAAGLRLRRLLPGHTSGTPGHPAATV